MADRKGPQPLTQAELERQQILNEMKKKNSLLTDNSWIRQRSTSSVTNKEADMPPMRRYLVTDGRSRGVMVVASLTQMDL